MKTNVAKIIFNPLVIVIVWILFMATPFAGLVRHFLFLSSVEISHSLLGIFNVIQRSYFWLLMLINLLIVYTWYRNLSQPHLINKKHYYSLVFVIILAVINEITVRSILYLDIKYYGNYIYSNFGILPSQLQLSSIVNYLAISIIIAFFISIFEINNKKSKNTHKRINVRFNKTILVEVFAFLTIVYLSTYPFLNFSVIIKDAYQNYSQRIGSDYVYIDSLVKLVPENGVIIHPPQSSEWPLVGNQPVIRYFLYPRILVSGKLINTQKFADRFSSAYFVLIDKTHYAPGWPLINFDKKEISFDINNSVNYLNIEKIGEYLGKIVYKIKFNE